jgi:fumarylacetoacetase
MPITANDTNRKSWLEVPADSDFLFKTYLLFLTKENIVTVGTRIGDLPLTWCLTTKLF